MQTSQPNSVLCITFTCSQQVLESPDSNLKIQRSSDKLEALFLSLFKQGAGPQDPPPPEPVSFISGTRQAKTLRLKCPAISIPTQSYRYNLNLDSEYTMSNMGKQCHNLRKTMGKHIGGAA